MRGKVGEVEHKTLVLNYLKRRGVVSRRITNDVACKHPASDFRKITRSQERALDEGEVI